jgi:DNA-binding transcriptional MerR regulator
MSFESFKVGELAKRTGLTVRTLHHYDEIGLLRPSLRSDAGHRLYSAGDVARLQQIVSLRQLGFSLDEIGACLERAGYSPLEVIRLHVSRLREQIEQERELCERLDALASQFESTGEVSADDFLRAIEVMNMIEQYYTPEQLELLRKRREAGGAALEERIQQGPALWNELFAKYQKHMELGTDPADPAVQALEERRQALVNEFTGGDAGIEQSLQRLWTEQGDALAAQYGIDPQLLAYLEKVGKAADGHT